MKSVKYIKGVLSAATKKHAVLFCILLFTIHYSLFTTAQVAATFRGDSTKAEIGDHLIMKLVINASPDVLIDFPTFPGDTIGKIDIIGKSKIDTARLASNIVYSQNITIMGSEEGNYVFLPSKVYFLNKNTKVLDSTYTNAWQFMLTSMPVDTSKPIKPIKAPLKVDYKLNEFTWWIIGLIVFIIAAIMGFFLYRRYKKKPAAEIVRPRPKEPAHIWAAKELRKLEQEKLWQQDEVKQYYSRMSDILRSYLEYRFDYYVLEATTEEIIQEVNKRDITMDASSRLQQTLRLADFVKFAKMNPAPDQNTKSIQDALAFVDMTKQIETVNAPIKK